MPCLCVLPVVACVCGCALPQVHSMAWSIWHHQAPRSRYTLQALDPLTRRQLVDTAAINRFMNRQKPTSNDQPWHLGG